MQSRIARERNGLKKRILFLAAITAAPSLFSSMHAQAATFTWDSDSTANGVILDGAGTWNTTLTNFTNDGSTTNVSWNNAANNVAVFGATAAGGSVTFASAITANGLAITQNGYIFSGSGTNALTLAGN